MSLLFETFVYWLANVSLLSHAIACMRFDFQNSCVCKPATMVSSISLAGACVVFWDRGNITCNLIHHEHIWFSWSRWWPHQAVGIGVAWTTFQSLRGAPWHQVRCILCDETLWWIFDHGWGADIGVTEVAEFAPLKKEGIWFNSKDMSVAKTVDRGNRVAFNSDKEDAFIVHSKQGGCPIKFKRWNNSCRFRIPCSFGLSSLVIPQWFRVPQETQSVLDPCICWFRGFNCWDTTGT